MTMSGRPSILTSLISHPGGVLDDMVEYSSGRNPEALPRDTAMGVGLNTVIDEIDEPVVIEIVPRQLRRDSGRPIAPRY